MIILFRKRIYKFLNTNTTPTSYSANSSPVSTNVGEKIKAVAKIEGILLGLIGVVVGLGMIYRAYEMQYGGDGFYRIGFVFLIVGPIVGYYTYLFIYGFGELITTNVQLRDLAEKNSKDNEKNKL
jgi:uncharacterized membrane protein